MASPLLGLQGDAAQAVAAPGGRVAPQTGPKWGLHTAACKRTFAVMSGSGLGERSAQLFDPAQDVVTEAAALQSLAHPLRLRMLGLLRTFGPSTATRLALQCGESSGLTSYHLRQLAAAGFVIEADTGDLSGVERSGARERWWKAAQRSTFTAPPPPGDELAAAASSDFSHAVVATYAANSRAWLSSQHSWPEDWRHTATFADVPLRLTAEETHDLSERIEGLLASYRRHDPSQRPGSSHVPQGAVVVSVQYQIFPAPDQEPPSKP